MTSIREQITSQIKDELVAGNFEAGVPLRETVLAKRFGVSRGPVRDAFLQLSQEGFLTYQANRGVTVRHPPAEADRGFIASLRCQIELHVLTKGFHKLSEELLEPVHESLQAIESASLTGEVAEFARADINFHESVMIAGGGEEYLQVWRQLCAKMLLAYTRLESFGEAYLEHAEIYEALKARDQEKAIAAIKRNVT